MNKVIVIGTTGSGKSTLAKRLAAEIQSKYISLDQLFWEPNWQESTDEVFFERIKSEINAPKWVIDGNYTRTIDLTWPDADTVVWIDLPFWLTFYQLLARSIRRAIQQEELWEGTGNRESFRRMLSKDSILIWLLQCYWRNKERYPKRFSDPAWQHIHFLRLRSRHEIKRFLEKSRTECTR